MLLRIVRMTFDPTKVEEFLAVFQASKSLIRHFPGCTHLELMRDDKDPAIFTTYSLWEEAKDLENYRQSELFKGVWAKTKPLFAARPVAFSLEKFIKVEG
jgi:quinol monooxygenase YgiN